MPSVNAQQAKAGERFTPALFEKVWEYHNEWTAQFFAEMDRRGDPGRFDRSKAGVIMELLKKQLLSPRYIQHSARVLFVVGEANQKERGQILAAVFDLVREANIAMDKGEFRQGDVPAVQEFLATFDKVFAVLEDNDAAKLAALGYGSTEAGPSDAEIDKIVAERNAAKKKRDFATADRIRKELADRGILIEDTKDGSVRWKRK